MPTMKTLAVAVLCGSAAAVMLVAAPVAADSAADKEAVRIAAEAKRQYAAGRYDAAARLFKQAYAKVPEPTLLYNAARAYERDGRGAEALPLFRLYLAVANHDNPDTRAGRAEAQRHIVAIEKQLAARQAREARQRRELEEKARQANKPPPPMPQPKPAPVVTPPEVTNRKAVHRPDLFKRISNPGGWSTLETAAVIVGSVGAVALISGIGIHAGNDELDKLDERLVAGRKVMDGRTFYSGVTQKETESIVNSYNSTAATANVLIFGGLVAGGVAVWLWTSDDGGGSARVSASPTNGGGVFAISGRF